jgi:carbamate kinase
VAAQGREVVGVAGVIDKDRCSARLAADIGADVLVLLTGVPRVALDYGTRWERELPVLTVADARRGLAAGDFPAGSMGPKIEAALRYLDAGGGDVVITSPDRLADALAGRTGTRVVAGAAAPPR